MPSRTSISRSSIRSRTTRSGTVWAEALALERLRALGAPEARLWTLEGNASGRRFYEQRSWALTDETRVVPYPPNPLDVQYARPLP